MKSAPAPKIATWLLKRLNSTPDNEALIGDLVEQYLQGRSRLWYWKQTFLAIAVSFGGEISRHPALTLRAVASGWAVIFLYRLLFRPSTVALSITLSVMQLHAHGVLYGALSHLYWYFIYTPVLAAAGWLVARLHREHRGVMVLAFAASKVLTFAPHVFSYTTHAVIGPAYLRYVGDEMWAAVTTTAMILLGGIWQASSAIRGRKETMELRNTTSSS